VDAEDLGGLAEVAETLGVSRQAVSNWAAGRARPSFPAPIKRLKATPVWSLQEVVAWYEAAQQEAEW
jgi:predicted DNA-binding transcriptional regulator AlpA